MWNCFEISEDKWIKFMFYHQNVNYYLTVVRTVKPPMPLFSLFSLIVILFVFFHVSLKYLNVLNCT